MRWDLMAWLDLETTGTDERTGHILEVGIVLSKAKPPFEEVIAGSWIVDPSVDDPRWRSTMGDFVTNMHTENGLLADLEAMERRPSEATIEQEILAWLKLCAGSDPLLLAGSGVAHFDRRWIRHRMPKLEERFDYVIMDVGVIRRAVDLSMGGHRRAPSFGGQTDGTPHRALDDARDHLEEFRRYSALLAGAVEQIGETDER